MIKQAYLAQVVQCGVLPAHAEELWLEIEAAYTEPGRYFHDLSHLEYLFSELKPLSFTDWETVLFAIVYHDVVYDVSQHIVQHDNEERSAAFAERHLNQMGYPPEKIQVCRHLIMATENHQASPDNDTNLFTDADLSILGRPWDVYDAYRQNVRLEYSVYPDSIYQAGRRKVLLHFLQMEPLFKTEHFRQLYEHSAKENMQKEISLLRS
jgi:predicted metal-dependent HD superfamily phosphohydrolase